MFETALKILKKFNEYGYKAYIVGGFVRDKILDISSFDVDICTSATPKQIMELFDSSTLPTEEYGSVTLFIKNNRFEITTFRKETSYINNRKPQEIFYIDNLLDDLKRRDFKMNTLCIDKDGNIIDLLNGKEDIDNKVINTVGNSDERFKEDALRILRAIRFATILNFKLSDEVKDAIIKNKDLLRNLSYNRKKQELDKIFASTNIKYGIELLTELGLDEPLEIYNLKDVALSDDLLAVWASLEISPNYVFNSNEREIINKTKEVVKSNIDDLSIYKYGLYVNQLAADILKIDKQKIAMMHDNLKITSRKDINITSYDIMNALNKKPGPYFKQLYEDIEIRILKGNLNNNKEEIEKYIIENY